jgi:DNA polymerase alpha subunit B
VKVAKPLYALDGRVSGTHELQHHPEPQYHNSNRISGLRADMDNDVTAQLSERFERYCTTKENGAIPSAVMGELESILRLYDISAEELDFKWQAYSMKMGAEETQLDLKTVRDWKKTLSDTLERESRARAQARHEPKRTGPAPRAGVKGADDVFGM